MQLRAAVRAQAYNVAGVGRNLRLIEHDVKHTEISPRPPLSKGVYYHIPQLAAGTKPWGFQRGVVQLSPLVARADSFRTVRNQMDSKWTS
jgi:hypothetical protein